VLTPASVAITSVTTLVLLVEVRKMPAMPHTNPSRNSIARPQASQLSESFRRCLNMRPWMTRGITTAIFRPIHIASVCAGIAP
jgi:hypothetical protein